MALALRRVLAALWLCLLTAAPGPAPVWALVLDLPLAVGQAPPVPSGAELHTAFIIQNYADQDPGPGWRDYAGGFLSYDGHRGTDFRVTGAAMDHGVAVLAAADGVVRAVRDGMDDVSVRETGREAVRGREAGNTVVLDHGGGWTTQYSHLRKGSVAVARGRRVKAGERLGLVGLSGMTEFPHLELTVRKDDAPLCPFAGPDRAPDILGRDGVAGFGPEPDSLWSSRAADGLAYTPTGLLDAGFAVSTPDMGTVRSARRMEAVPLPAPPEGWRPGDARPMPLYFWAAFFGVREGDTVRLSLTGPGQGEGAAAQGEAVVLAEDEVRITTRQAQRVVWVGLGPRAGLWPGLYQGELSYERQGSLRFTVRRGMRLAP